MKSPRMGLPIQLVSSCRAPLLIPKSCEVLRSVIAALTADRRESKLEDEYFISNMNQRSFVVHKSFICVQWS